MYIMICESAYYIFWPSKNWKIYTLHSLYLMYIIYTSIYNNILLNINAHKLYYTRIYEVNGKLHNAAAVGFELFTFLLCDFRPFSDLPHIILPSTKYTSINGGVASMACEATGDQPIHISWIRGSVQLNSKSSNLRYITLL